MYLVAILNNIERNYVQSGLYNALVMCWDDFNSCLVRLNALSWIEWIGCIAGNEFNLIV